MELEHFVVRPELDRDRVICSEYSEFGCDWRDSNR